MSGTLRIMVMSDLHFEFHADGGEAFVAALSTDCDVLVLAGDVTTNDAGIFLAMQNFSKRFREVVYVPGNHEFWKTGREGVNIAMRKIAERLPNVHPLMNETWTHGGVRFLGTTLWFPRSMQASQMAQGWSDFLRIPGALKTRWLFDANDEARDFLRRELAAGGATVVVTHHLPSDRSTSPAHLGEATNCFYVNSLDDMIRETSPALWVHGHTHSPQDYMIGETRIVCNPYGYQMIDPADVRHLNTDFVKDLVVEVPVP